MNFFGLENPLSPAARKLGYIEAHMNLMQTLFRGTTQSVTVYTLEGPVTLELFRDAMESVLRRSPILRVRIAEAEDGPRFESSDAVALHGGNFGCQDGEDWESGFESANNHQLPGAVSPWRIAWINPSGNHPQPRVLFTAHHSLFDGMGLNGFFAELFAAMNALLEGNKPRETHGRIPPRAESSPAVAIPWERFMEKRKAQQILFNDFDALPYREMAPLSERTTRSLFRILGREETDGLIGVCGSRKISVNSFLSAVLMLAVKQVELEKERFLLNTAYSLREACGKWLAPEEPGCFVSVLSIPHRISDCGADPFLLGMDHQGKLFRSILSDAKLPDEYAYGRMREALRPLSNGSSFFHDLAITYSEKKPSLSGGKIQAGECFVSINRRLGNLAMTLQATRYRGRIFMTFNYTHPLQTRAWAESVAESFSELLVRWLGGAGLSTHACSRQGVSSQ